jgi:hypothetical protein
MLSRRRFIHFLLIVVATFSAIVRAQTIPAIDEEDRVVLNGNVSPLATARNDIGFSSSTLASR